MGAPALPWSLPLLVLLSLATPPASAGVIDASQLACFYNSRANISCVWHREQGLQSPACHLHAKSDQRDWNKTCALLPGRQEAWACDLILGRPDSQSLTSVDVVTVSVVCWEEGQWRRVTTQDFKPFEHVRLMAPDSLQVTAIGTHGCNVTWRISRVSHYIDKYLEFEARVRSLGRGWEEASPLSLKQRQQWLHLETLAPDTQYEVQVRVQPQQGGHTVWSPWSQPLAFRTRPAAGPGKAIRPLPWASQTVLSLGVVVLFIFLVYFLVNCRYSRPWLKKFLKCHIPDPSGFFSQLSSEHGGDFQKWLSSPFPSSSFSPGGPAPEISPLEVLDRDVKATRLLLLPQDKAPAPSPSPSPSGHSQTSCFTNQGYFFFHLPNTLEIESCQVYFTYNPCAQEEPEDGGAGAPAGSPQLPLPPAWAEDDAYCTFPPGGDLLLFSPALLGGLSPANAGASEERPQEGAPQDPGPQPPAPPAAADPDLRNSLPRQERVPGAAGRAVPGPGPGQGEASGPPSGLALNTDVYLSLQELQGQDPAHLV